jgi:hypothetical protein
MAMAADCSATSSLCWVIPNRYDENMCHYERALGGPALTVHTSTMVKTSKFI